MRIGFIADWAAGAEDSAAYGAFCVAIDRLPLALQSSLQL